MLTKHVLDLLKGIDQESGRRRISKSLDEAWNIVKDGDMVVKMFKVLDY